MGTDKTKPGTDADGLKDGEEQAYGTNPLVKDTDGDAFSDGEEIQAGTDPLDPTSIPETYAYVSPTGECNGKTPCYDTIQKAVEAARTGAVIRIVAGTYDETIQLNASKILILDGGWDASFASQTGITILRKAPGAPLGSVTLRQLIIKPGE